MSKIAAETWAAPPGTSPRAGRRDRPSPPTGDDMEADTSGAHPTEVTKRLAEFAATLRAYSDEAGRVFRFQAGHREGAGL